VSGRFEPQTDIERRILDVQAGQYPADRLIRELADTDLYVPSHGALQSNGDGFSPVIIEQGDMPFVAVFTSLSQVEPGLAPHVMKANGKVFFPRLPAGYGVVFNPDTDAQLLLPPDGVSVLKLDLGKP
jgi:hypothetical protein